MTTTTGSAALRAGEPRRLARRHLWLVPGLGLALVANAQASQLGVGIVPILVFGIAPDLPRLVGLNRPAMLRLHDAMHHPAPVLAVLLVSALTGMSSFAFVGALAWLGHIVVGWGTGDRIRSAETRVITDPRGISLGHAAPAPEVTRSSAP